MKKKKKRLKLRWGRIIGVLISLVFIGVLIWAGSFYLRYRSEQKELESNGSNAFIAIVGIDSREELDSVRSDVTMLAHVDIQNSKLSVISIPRDTLVEIPCIDNQSDKITHSYAYGHEIGGDEEGKACVLGTIQNVFELSKLEHYVLVNFEDLISMVDRLGGITITPTKSFCEMTRVYNDETGTFDWVCFNAGEPTEMTGAMALAYAYHRSSDNDLARTKRQQEVITAMIAKIKTLSKRELYNFATAVLKTIDTNVTLPEVLAYYDVVQNENFEWEHLTAPGGDYYLDDYTYYYKLDDEWLENTIKEMQQEEIDDETFNKGQEGNE